MEGEYNEHTLTMGGNDGGCYLFYVGFERVFLVGKMNATHLG